MGRLNIVVAAGAAVLVAGCGGVPQPVEDLYQNAPVHEVVVQAKAPPPSAAEAALGNAAESTVPLTFLLRDAPEKGRLLVQETQAARAASLAVKVAVWPIPVADQKPWFHYEEAADQYLAAERPGCKRTHTHNLGPRDFEFEYECPAGAAGG